MKVSVARDSAGVLGCSLSDADNTISAVVAGGAADAAGLKVGWLVTSVNGKAPFDELKKNPVGIIEL